MGQIVKFFGWMLICIALTLVIFGHITMVFIYSFDYLWQTLFPKNPSVISSIWFIFGSVIPGGALWLVGLVIEKFGQREDAADAKAEAMAKADAESEANRASISDQTP